MPDDFDELSGEILSGPTGSDFDTLVSELMPDPGATREQKREILRRMAQSDTSLGRLIQHRGETFVTGQLDLLFQDDDEDSMANFERQMDLELRGHLGVESLTSRQATKLLAQLPEIPPVTDEDRAKAAIESFNRGFTSPGRGMAHLLMDNLEGVKTPSGHVISAEDVQAGREAAESFGALPDPEGRIARAREDLAKTSEGRLLLGGAEALGAVGGMRPVITGFQKAGLGALAGPMGIGVHGFQASGGDPNAFAGGVAFGGLAHLMSAPLRAFFQRLPPVQQSKFLQVVGGRAESALTFAAADQILHGEDGEQALLSAILGAGLGKSLKGAAPAQAKALPPGQRRPALPRGTVESEIIVPAAPEKSIVPGRQPALPGGRRPGLPQGALQVPFGPLPFPAGLPALPARAPRPALPAGMSSRRSPMEPAPPFAPGDPPTIRPEVVPAPRRQPNPKNAPDPLLMDKALEPLAQAKASTPKDKHAKVPATEGRPAFRINEAGFMDLSVVPEAAKKIAGPVVKTGKPVVKEIARKADREVFESMFFEIGRSGPVGKQVEKAFRLVEHRAMQETAAVRRPFEAVIKLAGQKEHRAGHRSLSERPADNPYSRLEAVYEGRTKPTAAEAPIIEAMRAAVVSRGSRAEKAGVPGFRNRPDRLPRVSTGDLHRVLRHGEGSPEWKAVEAAWAKDMGGVKQARSQMEEMAQNFERLGPPGLDRRAQFEFRRKADKLAAFVDVPGRGTLQLFHTDPVKVARSLLETGPKRIAFGRTFGFEAPGGNEPRLLNQLRKAFQKERGSGSEDLFNQAARAAQGAPIEQPKTFTDPDVAGVMGGLHAASQLLKATVLSRAHRAAWVEPVGPIMDVMGPRRLAEAYARSITESISEMRTGVESPRAARLRDMGLVEKRLPKRNMDPNRPVADRLNRLADIIREVGLIGPASRVANDRVAAYGVDAWMNTLRAGKGTRLDRRHLEIYGNLSRAQAEKLVSGEATEAQYVEATRRVVPNLTGASGQTTLQKSRLQNRNWFRVFPFTNYAMTQIRTEARWLRNAGRIAANKDIPRAQRVREMATWVRGYAQHLVGRGAQAILWQAAGHMIAGGNIDQYLKRWENNPEGEFLSGMFVSMLAGSFGQVALAFAREDGVGDAVVRGVWPISVANDFFNIAAGKDRYEGRTALEKVEVAARRWYPMSNDILAILAALGVRGESAKESERLRVAFREFNRFRFGTFPRTLGKIPDFGKRLSDEEKKAGEQFNVAMNRAVRKIGQFASREEILEEMRKALKAKGPRAVRSFLLRRRKMASGVGRSYRPFGRLSDVERSKIHGALTEELIDSIRQYDLRLTTFADWLAPRRRRR